MVYSIIIYFYSCINKKEDPKKIFTQKKQEKIRFPNCNLFSFSCLLVFPTTFLISELKKQSFFKVLHGFFKEKKWTCVLDKKGHILKTFYSFSINWILDLQQLNNWSNSAYAVPNNGKNKNPLATSFCPFT